MTGIASKKHRRSAVRSWSLLIVCCLMASVLTSCSRTRFQKKKVDVPELARLVVDSIQDINESEQYFNRIPEEQKDGLSYSEYYEYIRILQNMMPRSSRVVSFDIVQGKEKDDLLSAMLSNDTEEYGRLIRGCIPVQVTTTGERVSGTPLLFYLQTMDDGSVYLSRPWILSCLKLYAFSVNYFEAYANENVTDVISLLSFTEVPEPLPESRDVLKEKAKEMIRFYSHNVKSKYSEYEMISIDASNLVYLQPEVLDTQLQTSVRQVRFRSDSDDKISVVDPIESELRTADLYLYYNGRRTVRIGEHAAPSQLTNLFGDPITISCGPVMDGSFDNENGRRNILIRYSGFTITVYGVYHGEDDWEGTYTRFRIWDSEAAGIGASLRVNQTSWDILTRYPFADETGFVLELSIDNDLYRLTIDLDRDHANKDGSVPISTMILSRLHEGS